MSCDRYTKYYKSHGAVCLFRSRRRHGVHGAPCDWGIIELQRLQESDQSLNNIRKWSDEGKCQRSRPKWKERFYLDNSIMYREHETSAKKGSASTTLLVLPTHLREGVIEVAHHSILGGHLGGKKTLDRVTSNFHWPGVAGDVQRYVQSCDICQRTIPKG